MMRAPEIPGYELLEPAGGNPVVAAWKARQVSLDRVVTIKVLDAQHAAREGAAQDFLAAARAAARLAVPGIVPIHDVGEHKGVYYVISEFVEGISLARHLREHGAMRQKDALAVSESVARAMQSAWSAARVTHRDIRPQEIVIDQRGAVRLDDLGMPKGVDAGRLAEQIAAGRILVVPNYLAPEQARCEERIDCRTDMYGLGATLYHMLTGRMPFAELPPRQVLEAHVSGNLPHPREISADVTHGAGQLLTRLMMKDPRDRYRDWDAALDAFRKAARGRILLAPRHRPPSTISPPATGALSASPPAARRPRSAAPALPLGVRVVGWLFVLACSLLLAYALFATPPRPGPPPRAAAPSAGSAAP